ncbi:V-type ATP synthase subunit F [archaeon]|nr:MAG: V-type ATP synthase subunit F [archaeon]
MEIAVVGNDDFVTGFALAGVRNVYSAEDSLDEKVGEALKQGNTGILVMQQEQFKSLNNKTKKLLEKTVKPVLVLVSEKGKEEDIKKMIKRSLGVDLWA